MKDFFVVFKYSRSLAYRDNRKLCSNIRRVEIKSALTTQTTVMNATTPYPLKQSICDVPERARSSTNDDVDMQMVLQRAKITALR